MKMVIYYERLQAVVDSLGICLLCSNWGGADQLGPDDLAHLYSAATGDDLTGRQLMLIGERIHNIEKAFNTIHKGFNREDDYPPQRFVDEPVKTGPFAGERLELDQWNKLLDEYYELQGWDKKTGWQTKKGLEKLKLEELKEKLQIEGRLL